MAKNLKIEYLYSGLLRVSQCSSISDIFYRGQLIPELEIGDFIFYNVDVFTRTINESRTIVEYDMQYGSYTDFSKIKIPRHMDFIKSTDEFLKWLKT